MALALRAAVVLFQCPPSFVPTRANITNLVRFFAEADRGGLAFAWEPAVAWPEKVVWTLCQELQPDLRRRTPSSRPPPANGVAYFRLSRQDRLRLPLHRRGPAAVGWPGAAPTRPVYCLFNNVSMGEDALRLEEILGEKQE